MKLYVALMLTMFLVGCGDTERRMVEKPLVWNNIDSMHIVNDMYRSFVTMTGNGAKDVIGVENHIQANEMVSEAELLSLRIALDGQKDKYFPRIGGLNGFNSNVYVAILGVVDQKSNRKIYTISAYWTTALGGKEIAIYNTVVRKEEFVER